MERIKRFISLVKGVTAPLLIKDTGRETLGKILEIQALKRPEQALFLFEDSTYTYKQVNEAANQYAHLFISLGFQKGDTIALIMGNRPEYLVIHAGLAKIGPHIRGQVLKHALTIVDAKAVISDNDFIGQYCEVVKETAYIQPEYVFVDKEGKTGKTPEGIKDIKPLLDEQPTENPVLSEPVTLGDTLEYIYTSGTTGLPKATVLKQKKWVQLGFALGGIAMKAIPGDIQYLCLPLYHNSGINIAWPLTLMWGGGDDGNQPEIFRKKFLERSEKI